MVSRKYVQKRIEDFGAAIGSLLGTSERQIRRDLGERITEAESNLVALVALQEGRISALEARLQAAEQRAGPRLAHDNAA